MTELKLLNSNELNTIKVEVNICVVYTLHFGDKFYIGTTNNLPSRVASHRLAINNGLKGKMGETIYDKIIAHIRKENVPHFTFKIYSFCDNEKTAHLVEDFLLKKNIYNLNLLNVNKFSSGIKKKIKIKNITEEVKKWNIMRKDGDSTKILATMKDNERVSHTTLYNAYDGRVSNKKLFNAMKKYYDNQTLQ